MNNDKFVLFLIDRNTTNAMIWSTDNYVNSYLFTNVINCPERCTPIEFDSFDDADNCRKALRTKCMIDKLGYVLNRN